MKRQESLRSSSSMTMRETANSSYHTPVPHAPDSSIGCMAGVFHLISSKYRTRRKFLTFRRKQTTSYLSPQPRQPAPARKGRGKIRARLIEVHTNADNVRDENSREFPSLSCQIPRSPTIPPEIRRSNFLKSREIFRSPAPSAVARLMGLEEAPPPPGSRTPELAAEKRRKLLGALEKCDDDLQALKRIIEAARSTYRLQTSTTKCTDQMSSIVEQEQPSPVSVLQDFAQSPPPSTAKRTENGQAMLHQQRKKPREDNTEIATFYFHANHQSYVSRSLFHPRRNPIRTGSPPPPSSTMVEAVNEACRDVEMGQRMEIERVAVVLEDFVYRDLIEEFMKELMDCCHVYSYLPFEKCKRKLSF